MCGLSSAWLQGTLLSPTVVASSPIGSQDRWWLVLHALCSRAEVGMRWLCSALSPSPRAWAEGDLQQRGFGALLLACSAVPACGDSVPGLWRTAVLPKPVTADVMIMVRMVSSWSHPLPGSGLHPLIT